MTILRGNVAFRRLFLAHSISRAGDAFNTVALVVLVFELTGSGVGVAGTVAFEILPVLLLGPVAGMVVDRFPRWRVMVAADLVRAALAALIAFSDASTPLAYAVAFGLSTGALLFNPAASSLVPDLLDGQDKVVEANSALWTVAVAAQILLAPVAGGLIATVGVRWAFSVNALSYVASALFLWRLDGTCGGEGVGDRRRGVAAGLHAVRSNPLLARLAVVQVLAALSAGATGGLLVVLAAEHLGVGPGGFGLMLSAIGIGAVAGPALFRRSIRTASPAWLFGPFAARGMVDLVLASATSPWLAGPALALYGMSTSTGMVAYQSTLQVEVPSAIRGRLFSFFDVLWNAARLVSLGLGGLLADRVGIRAVYLLGGLTLLLAAAIGFASEAKRQPAPPIG